jgi:predicted nucleic acid-binding protein
VTDLVVDASVVLKWFRSEGEHNVAAARTLREAFSDGRLTAHAPPLVRLEIINVAARRWGWDEARLSELTESLDELGIIFGEPDPLRVARWAARGLTAYDAAYVALAEAESIRLVTDDAWVLAAAPGIAIALSSADQLLVRPAPDLPTEEADDDGSADPEVS